MKANSLLIRSNSTCYDASHPPIPDFVLCPATRLATVMKHRPPRPPTRDSASAYRAAFARLDQRLEDNTQPCYAERIRLMRLAAFADVDAFIASGELVLPQ